MKRLTVAWILAVLAGFVSGCGTVGGRYRMVEPRRQTIDGVYSVEPRLGWSSFVSGKVETWTIDGASLESLRFFKSINDGEPLLRGANDDLRPRFRTTMMPLEVTEFIADSLFGARFTPTNVRPAPFGNAQGFRFEVSYATRDGVKRNALVAGTVLLGRLHVVVYEGTSLYHFDKHREEAERIIASIRLI